MAAVGADLVACAANRSNERALVSGIHLAAKIVEVGVHDIRRGVKIKLPHLLDNGGAGNGLAFVAHQEFQQSELLWAEIDVVKPASHGVTDTIDFEVFNLENRARGPAASAQDSANARSKLGEGKRFCHVVVRSGIQPADAFLDYVGVRHEDHGQNLLPSPSLLRPCETGRAHVCTPVTL